MSQENKTQQTNLDVIVEMARTEALKHGGHVPMLIVTGTEKSMVGQLELPDTHAERAQVFFNTGFSLAQEKDFGILMQVFFITEGWLSLPENGELKVRPSQDPNRLEVLLIAGLYVLRKQHSLIVLEMVRDEHKQLVELREYNRLSKEGQAESPLLEALILGYATGLGADKNSQFLC